MHIPCPMSASIIIIMRVFKVNFASRRYAYLLNSENHIICSLVTILVDLKQSSRSCGSRKVVSSSVLTPIEYNAQNPPSKTWCVL